MNARRINMAFKVTDISVSPEKLKHVKDAFSKLVPGVACFIYFYQVSWHLFPPASRLPHFDGKVVVQFNCRGGMNNQLPRSRTNRQRRSNR